MPTTTRTLVRALRPPWMAEVPKMQEQFSTIEDNEVLIDALLHDVIEDCSGPHQMHIELRRQEIREHFGETVLSYVEAATAMDGGSAENAGAIFGHHDKALPKAERKQAQVNHAAHIPHGAKLVKIADKTANLRDITNHPPANWSPERKTEYFAWAKQVIDVLRGSHAGLEALFDEAHGQQ